MGDRRGKAKKDYAPTPSLKRSDSHLTPPKMDEKRGKMAADEEEIPNGWKNGSKGGLG